jgi:hypothetical protein
MGKAGRTWLLVVLTVALLASIGANIYLWLWNSFTTEILNMSDTANVDFRTSQYRKIRSYAEAGEDEEIEKLLNVLHMSDMQILHNVRSRLAKDGEDTTRIEKHIKEEEANSAEGAGGEQPGET